MSLTHFWIAVLACVIVSIDIATAIVHVSSSKEPRAVEFAFTQRTKTSSRGHLRLKKRQKTQNVGLSSISGVEYIVNVTVGTPPQSLSVSIDTGSSDFWVPSVDADLCADQPDVCAKFGTYRSNVSTSYKIVERNTFYLGYADLSDVEGDWANETIGIGSAKLHNQQIGIARNITQGFNRAVNVTGGQPGVMGLSFPIGESIGNRTQYPTLLQSLKASGIIKSTAFSLWLNDRGTVPDRCLIAVDLAANGFDIGRSSGSLLFGGVDTAKYSGSLKTARVRARNNTDTVKARLAIALTSITANNEKSRGLSVLNNKIVVVLDSGSSGTLLPNDTTYAIYKQFGAVYDHQNGPIIPCNAATAETNLTFSFGRTGPQISTPLQNFILPMSFRVNSSTLTTLESKGPVCTFVVYPVAPLETETYLGIPFLQSAYTVFDLENDEISLAQALPNATGTDILEIIN